MNPGGDAAEQVVRLSLEGVEVAARISGNGAKHIALLLYAALKQEQKTKGKARLTSMLKTGKELKVYTITQKDLATFSKEAKRYGVLYCVLKDRKNTDPNAAVDVIARAEDASKIQRITERFRLATVNRADVALSISRDKSVKDALREGQAAKTAPDPAGHMRLDPEWEIPHADDGQPYEGRRIMGGKKKEEPEINPGSARTVRDRLSEQNLTEGSLSHQLPGGTDRPSVREKLSGYKADIAGKKARELAEEKVSKGIDAAKDAAKAVLKAPGKER